MVYAVTWQLNGVKPTADKLRLIQALEEYEFAKDPALENVRFISTPKKIDRLHRDLHKYLTAPDRMLITLIHSEDQSTTYAGQVGGGVWDWIREQR